ncbi:LPXTG cell wall anchor domain-containing protein [Carnobacterium divergens]|uniref:LPXTG cell wall anchor domain-containing protein n=1 Tax=Carnobacterium divergens TaxID=2748 RepID=UPI0039B0C198
MPNEKQILKEDFQTKKEVSLPQTGEIQSNPIGMIIGGFLFVISLGGYWISFKGRS